MAWYDTTDEAIIAKLESLGFARQITGDWTPAPTCAVSTGLSISTSADPSNVLKGKFARTGNKVWVHCRANFGMSYTAQTSGRFRIGGLPFYSINEVDTQNVGPMTFQCLNAPTGYVQHGPLIFPNRDYVEFYSAGAGVAERGIQIAPNAQGDPYMSNNQPIVLIEFDIEYLTDDPWPA